MNWRDRCVIQCYIVDKVQGPITGLRDSGGRLGVGPQASAGMSRQCAIRMFHMGDVSQPSCMAPVLQVASRTVHKAQLSYTVIVDVVLRVQ